MQHVGEARADNLDIVGEAEAPLEAASRDPAVQIATFVVLFRLAAYQERILFIPFSSGTSALYAEALKALVEAGELPAGVDQALLPTSPGRMRLRVDVEPQGVPGFPVGRTGLVRGPVGQDDGDLMIIGVNSFSHQTVSQNLRGCNETEQPTQSGI